MNDAIKIFVDADAFVALAVETDTNHEKARSLLSRLTVNPVLFLTSNYVFSESITIISQRASHQTAVTFITKMQSMEPTLSTPFEIIGLRGTTKTTLSNKFKGLRPRLLNVGWKARFRLYEQMRTLKTQN